MVKRPGIIRSGAVEAISVAAAEASDEPDEPDDAALLGLGDDAGGMEHPATDVMTSDIAASVVCAFMSPPLGA
jgi:VIT1/CCC1 family predicted Fe2+/Mn2+ transporter